MKTLKQPVKLNVIVALMLMICHVHAFGFQTIGKDVIIAGTVINNTVSSDPKILKVNFCNPLMASSKSVKIDAKNTFNLRNEMLFTQNITLRYDGYWIKLYVTPGDSVHLTIDAALINKSNYDWLTITGDHAALSKQLNSCAAYLLQVPEIKYDISVDPPTMMQAIKADFARYVARLDKYAETNPLTPEIRYWAEADMKYSIANVYLVDYVNSGPDAQRSERAALLADPFFDVHNPRQYITMMFPYHLADYASALANADSKVSALKKMHNAPEAIEAGVKLLAKQPADICRDYMIYSYVASFLRKSPDVLDSVADVKSSFTEPYFYDHQIRLKNSIPKPNAEFAKTAITGVSYLKPAGLTAALPPQDMVAYLATTYPGKVIYVDIYATWCGPCMIEFDKSKPIHNAFHGQDLVFVNLCLQSKMPDWKKLVAKKKLEGEHYFLDFDASKQLMDTYRLNVYPSYLLIDKKGNLVTNTAPRPSEVAALTKRLNTLLAIKN